MQLRGEVQGLALARFLKQTWLSSSVLATFCETIAMGALFSYNPLIRTI
jgi:hypothetical protein